MNKYNLYSNNSIEEMINDEENHSLYFHESNYELYFYRKYIK